MNGLSDYINEPKNSRVKQILMNIDALEDESPTTLDISPKNDQRNNKY